MDNKEVIDHASRKIREFFNNDTSGHDWWHTYRVYQSSKIICQKEDGDQFITEMIALLHDYDDFKFSGNYQDQPNCKKLLNNLSVDSESQRQILDGVKFISFKGALVDNGIGSLEAKIVQDADRLDAIGAIGIARAFMYGGYAKQELWNPEIKPTMHQTFEEYKNNKSSSINHFYEKILLLKDRMNTVTGKTIAVKRHKFLESYLKEFFAEWDARDLEF